ncbi:tail assembly chaperone [Salmonella phage SAP012]|uniref:Putative tail assembly protein n=1 Tax=Salmonella phage SAP012 TaxID=2742114 RepID=A0A6J4EHM7_9CAUD|nr:tail assembly chaperone [Salmonella phage SAP012]BCG45209.1 putative tail assembly protein [Salmonella phage SAP012]
MEMFCYALAMLVASILINAALAPKPAQPQAATLKDMNIPQVKEGTAQAVVFGEAWTGDWQVLGFGDFRTSAVKAKQAKK